MVFEAPEIVDPARDRAAIDDRKTARHGVPDRRQKSRKLENQGKILSDRF